jgi:hypothetical protein
MFIKDIEGDGGSFGAILVKDGKIITTTWKH